MLTGLPMRLLVLLSVALCACPGPRPELPDDDGGLSGPPAWDAGTVELGVLPAFTPMPAAIDLEAGAQSGFHVPLVYRVRASQPQATFTFKVRRVRDGALVSRGVSVDDVSAVDGGAWTSNEVRAFLCPTPVGVNVLDEALRFEVVVTAPDGGLLGTAGAESSLRCPPSNREFCESICKG